VLRVYFEAIDPGELPAGIKENLFRDHVLKYWEGSPQDNNRRLMDDLRFRIQAARRRRSLFVAGVAAVALVLLLAAGAWDVSKWRDRMRGMDTASGDRPEQDAETETPSGWKPTPPVPVPGHLVGTAAAEAVETVLCSDPPTPTGGAERPHLQLEILARRHGQGSFAPLKNGDSLASEKDDYFIAVRPLTRGFVYVFQVDSAGRKDWLFPKNETSEYSSGVNPVEPGAVLQIPDAPSNRVLFLDRTTGREQIYTALSAERWLELEEALARQAPAAPKSEPNHPDTSLLAGGIRSPNDLLVRGVGGERTKTAPLAEAFLVQRLEGNDTCSLSISVEPLQATGSLLVIERWFRHVAPERSVPGAERLP
jgi:hypothetical protein